MFAPVGGAFFAAPGQRPRWIGRCEGEVPQLFGEARPRHSASCCQVAVAITYLCLPGLIVTMTILQCYPIVPHLTGKGVHGFIKDATPSLLGDADEVAVLCVAGVALRARPCQDTLELVNWEAFAYLQLCHMELFHPQLFHTQLLQTHRCHTQVFHTHLLHTQLFPHHSFTHNSVTHTHTSWTRYSFRHNSVTHTHTSWTHYSFRHNSVTHTHPWTRYSFRRNSVTQAHTHTSWTQYSFRHNSVTRTHYSFRRNSVTHTHTLEHATLSGATLSHRHTHTPLEHNTLLDTTLSHTHTPLEHATLSDTTLSHTHTHPLNTPLFQTQPCHTHTHLLNTQLCHTHTHTSWTQNSFTHNSFTHTQLFHPQLFQTQLFDTQLFHTQHFQWDFFDTPYFHRHSHTTLANNQSSIISCVFLAFPISLSRPNSQVPRTNPKNSPNFATKNGSWPMPAIWIIWRFPKSWGYPKSSKIDHFSIELPCFWGIPPFVGNLWGNSYPLASSLILSTMKSHEILFTKTNLGK